jgi:type IV pilus assembly protein PilA
MKLKNKYGFTLIELLAVIVVLAIIALIATPIVMNTIKNAKKGAAERTADNYIKQVETAVAEERLSKNEVLEGEYQITSDGNLCRDKSASCSDDNKIKIEMSGTKPTSGKIKITNGNVDQSSSSMAIGDYTVSYNSTKKTYEAAEKGNTSSTTVVYRWSTDTIKIGDTINPNDTAKFTKDASTLGKSYYLKHVLDKDNKVTESYICFAYKVKTTCVRGGSKDYFADNILIVKELQSKGVNCQFSSDGDSAWCPESYFNMNVMSTNGVSGEGNGDYCMIYNDGNSSCAYKNI